MNLNLNLILRIVAAAGFCLVAVAAYVLWQANRDWQRNMARAAEFAGKGLDKELLHISWGMEPQERFPEWETSLGLTATPGLCVTYAGVGGRPSTSVCNGWTGAEAGDDAPSWFLLLHRWAFGTDRQVTRPVAFRGVPKGQVIVSGDPDAAAAEAWRDVRRLIELQTLSMLAVSLVLYSSISRALRPASSIVAGLGRLERGDLTVRLSPFRLTEFQKIADGFNRLVEHLEESISERTALTRRLFHLQEEERRSLARDLHDEFGQCLAAISALAASINKTAKQDCPALLREGESIAKTCEHMMQLLRGTLAQLRPPEIEYGLAESLNSLVNDWNDRLAGKTSFKLAVAGDARNLPGVVGLNLFRIVQECLTNASKHAEASSVTITLARRTLPADAQAVELSIEDDGKAGASILSPGVAASSGVGLLGIRERVAALGGQLSFERRDPSGLIVRASIPIQA
jgi:signal transduction histidine kinase